MAADNLRPRNLRTIGPMGGRRRWQVYRGDVIPDDEASAALLCESAASIAQIVKDAAQFDAVHPFLARARAEVLDIVRGVRAGGHNIDDLEQKLAILRVSGDR